MQINDWLVDVNMKREWRRRHHTCLQPPGGLQYEVTNACKFNGHSGGSTVLKMGQIRGYRGQAHCVVQGLKDLVKRGLELEMNTFAYLIASIPPFLT